MAKTLTFSHSRLWAICTLKWWRHLIFPKSITISDNAIETFERLGVITFWRKEEERMAVSKLASVIVKGGLIWDTITIETTGGANALVLKGFSKMKAKQLRDKVQDLIESQ